MTDFSKPVNTDQFTDVLAMIRSNNEVLATMNFESATNIPLNSIKWSDTNSRFERYNGSTWVEFIPHASTTQRGPVVLSNSTTSTSQSNAASSNAVNALRVSLESLLLKLDGSNAMSGALDMGDQDINDVNDINSRSESDLNIACGGNGHAIIFTVRTSGGASRDALKIDSSGNLTVYGDVIANYGSVTA